MDLTGKNLQDKPTIQIVEFIVAPFKQGRTAGKSVYTYSGELEFIIMGVGQASASAYTDAFFEYKDRYGNPIPNPTIVGWDLCINSERHTGFINPAPLYDPSHMYHLTIQVPEGKVTFGNCDQGLWDNTGDYIINILSEPLDSANFLELPFDYELADQSKALQNWHLYDEGGRLASWFDHNLPNRTSGKGIVLNNGSSNSNPIIGFGEWVLLFWQL